MTIDNELQNQKIQYDINGEAAKIPALSSSKIDKYEYFTSEEILPANQKQRTNQAKCTYSPSRKAFKEQTKEQVKTMRDLNISDKANELKQIEDIFSQNVSNDLTSNKLKKSLSYKKVLN